MPHQDKDQKRAEYYLHGWQIRAIQRLAREQNTTPSDIIRQLLTEALDSLGDSLSYPLVKGADGAPAPNPPQSRPPWE